MFEQAGPAHLTADEVLRRARGLLPEIARGTVYNALGDLVDAGLLATVQTGGTQLYDTNIAPHQHFRCSSCSRLYDVTTRGVERLRIDDSGFAIVRAQVLFEGTCAACAGA